MRFSRLVPLALLAGPLLIGLAGCGRSSSPGGGAAANGGVKVGKPAPEIEGVDADNKTFRLSDYRGKVVLLSFWHSS